MTFGSCRIFWAAAWGLYTKDSAFKLLLTLQRDIGNASRHRQRHQRSKIPVEAGIRSDIMLVTGRTLADGSSHCRVTDSQQRPLSWFLHTAGYQFHMLSWHHYMMSPHDVTTWRHHMMSPHDVTTWCQHSSWVHVSFLLKMFFIASMKKCFLSTWQKKSNYFIPHVKKSQFFSPEQKKHHIQIRRGSLDQLPSHQAEQTLKTVSTLYKMSLSPRHILIILYN